MYSYYKNECLGERFSRDKGCISVYKMGLNRWMKIIEASLRDEFRGDEKTPVFVGFIDIAQEKCLKRVVRRMPFV